MGISNVGNQQNTCVLKFGYKKDDKILYIKKSIIFSDTIASGKSSNDSSR